MACFECGCFCEQKNESFDDTIRMELRIPLTLNLITHSNISWYMDRHHMDSHMMNEWFRDNEKGIYFLWYKDEYCDKHNYFHFTCLYVGKGAVAKRIANHWLNKNFATEGLVYITYFKCENRIAKYIEQLVLDIYNIPHNKNEMKGKERLCGYFTQTEVD